MISVCMATYNGEKFIKQQIDSILCQLSETDEVIISDDGSTDKTIEIIQSYNDKRIRLFHHKKNPRFAKIKNSRNFYYATDNFENALKEAKGDYIFLSDQDDFWLPNKKDRMVSALENYDCVMCNFSIIDDIGTVTKEKFYEKSPLSKYRLMNVLKSKYIGCCMAFTKDHLKKCLPFPEKLIAHDYWIGCLAEKSQFISEPLHLYRRYGENVSSSSEKSINSIFVRIHYRYEFTKLLIKQLRKVKNNQ